MIASRVARDGGDSVQADGEVVENLFKPDGVVGREEAVFADGFGNLG